MFVFCHPLLISLFGIVILFWSVAITVTALAGWSQIKRLSLAVFFFSPANRMWYCFWLLLFWVPFLNLTPPLWFSTRGGFKTMFGGCSNYSVGLSYTLMRAATCHAVRIDPVGSHGGTKNIYVTRLPKSKSHP
jgi:hypothetical protein